MFSDSNYEYDIAILGDDPAGLQLAKQACSEFLRVILVTENSYSQDEIAPLSCLAGLKCIVGKPSFESAHIIVCESAQGNISVTAQQVVIATGSDPVKPRWMIDHERVLLSGEENTLPDSCNRIAIIDRDHVEFISCDNKTTLNSHVIGLEKEQYQIRVFLESGESTVVDAIVAKWTEQQGRTSSLNLQAAGLSADDRGCLWCNGNYETWTAGIYAIGSVVGYPSPACKIEEQIDFVMNSILVSHEALSCA